MLAWFTLICLLLLAYISAENTKWGDSWFRTPQKYDISVLLEDNVDDNTVIGSGKPAAATVDVSDTTTEKVKRSKKKPKITKPDKDSDVTDDDGDCAYTGEYKAMPKYYEGT